ncbi:type II toxin-antitoxin system RelE/ParE family toxin [Bifidobacterium polysaccharolyticum]|uniref:type II toxin-antitoxin system RelE/ParE family toxin n=1 Tax=Bifidobacterium polysaccharolyticum TaxID=2750967 RepID=UPI00061B40DE
MYAKFLRDIKKIKKKHFDLSRLDQVLDDLANYNSALLKRKYRKHQLKGRWSEYEEPHVDADWLLVYKHDKNRMVLTLMTTGNHDQTL